MGTPRVFAPEAAASGATIDLPDDEAGHLTRVLRLDSGDRVRVFNGRGEEWTATVDRVGRQLVRVTLHDPVRPVREPQVAVTLAIAVLKGDKMDDIVRDAVMLGVSAIQPVLTARTEISAASIARSRRMARWERIAVSSAKQCGRAVVPAVRPVLDFAEVMVTREPLVMLVEPAATVRVRTLRELPPADKAHLLIGPEGGWTEDELARAMAAGAMLLTLGSQTLRADAAPIVGLTALRVQWGDL